MGVLIDGRTVQAGSTRTAQTVVIGTGPAGYAVAHELAAAGRPVLLLESGGLRGDDLAQRQAHTPLTTSEARYSLDGTRRIQVGGLINDWEVDLPGSSAAPASADGVRHLLLDPIDLAPRPEIDRGGWPLDGATLAHAYDRAAALLGLASLDHDEATVAEVVDTTGAAPWGLDQTVLRSRVFRFTGGDDLLGRLADLVQGPTRELVDLVHHAHVVRLLADHPSRILGVEVACGQARWTVRADRVVLATGGIENARLLLDNDAADGGVEVAGREHVGRWFMDHPQVRGGVLVPTDPGLVADSGFYDLVRVASGWVMGKLDLAPEVLVGERLANMSAVLLPRPAYAARPGSMKWFGRADATLAGRAASGLTFARHPRDVLATRRGLAQGAFPNVSTATGWSTDPERRAAVGAFEVFHQIEQLPHADNRVELSDERDAHGRRRARLTFRWHDQEVDSVRRGMQVFADELARAGIGTYHVDATADGRPRLLGGTHHHLGTTRMAADAADGVVDLDLQVHGVEGLYVVGGSVFPTGGYANPTLTIVALAARLGAHLAAV